MRFDQLNKICNFVHVKPNSILWKATTVEYKEEIFCHGALETNLIHDCKPTTILFHILLMTDGRGGHYV